MEVIILSYRGPRKEYEVFSSRLKAALEKSGKSQTQVAHDIGMSKSMISNYLSAKSMPESDRLYNIANLLNVDPAWLFGANVSVSGIIKTDKSLKALRVPVLGHIPAGTPIDAVEDILDWEELDPHQFNPKKDYFGLMVRGDSMYPEYLDGDIIIVQQESDAESGKDVVAYVNGYEATLKRLYKYANGSIELRAINPAYKSKKYTQEEMEKTPVVIMGYVKELRRRK